MSNMEMWAMIVGFILPAVIAVIQKVKWSDQVRSLVAFVICIITSVGTLFFNDGFTDWTNTPKVFLLIMVTAITTYQGFWKPTGAAGVIERNVLP